MGQDVTCAWSTVWGAVPPQQESMMHCIILQMSWHNEFAQAIAMYDPGPLLKRSMYSSHQQCTHVASLRRWRWMLKAWSAASPSAASGRWTRAVPW